MGQKTSNVLSWILLIMFVFLIGVSFFLIKREGEIADQIAELKEIYLCSEQASDLNMVYFDKYITNQNELKSLWWNTIINQGGLSIIFTVVVIVVTGSISFMTQNNIENQYKKNIEEGEQKLKDSILDVSCILNQHKGTFGAYMISDEAEESHLFACLNSFNNLKALTRNDFEEIYTSDLISLASYIWSTIHNQIGEGKQYKDKIKILVHTLFQRIQNKIDRCNIIEHIAAYRNSLKTPYSKDDTQTEKLILDDEIMQLIQKTFTIRKFNW